ncbi:MAG: hypothetical protein JWN19_2531 [Arthrobacter sp.]|nr:hypothetical protein [Arthrobacter sp.]
MLASHEDRTLAQSLRSRAFTITATDSIRVLTSGRTRALPLTVSAHTSKH